MPLPIYAIDFETTYDKKRDIKTLGIYNYLRHPETEIYLVAIAGSDGFEWVGNPKDAPWKNINKAIWVSHNAGFDQSCFECLKIPKIKPSEWFCTADLSVFINAPRGLKDAAKVLLNVVHDKTQREQMEGKVWSQLNEQEKIELSEYALKDARYCLQLWLKFNHQWPQFERDLSKHTRMMKRRGIEIDVPGIREAIGKLKAEIFSIGGRIPWNGEFDAKGKPIAVASPKKIIEHCIKHKLPPPSTTAQKSEEFEAWLEQYGDQAPFVKAVGDHRKANRLLNVLEDMILFSEKGRLYYGLKYFGAHTGRWSGDAGLNMQNFPRKSLFGVDARSFLIPKKGHKFIVADYSQIEARILCWFAGQWRMLEMIRNGIDVYEAHARATMGYSDPEPLKKVNPLMRDFAKMRVLALGYGLGGSRFKTIAKQWSGLDLSPQDAARAVMEYRRANPEIVSLWYQFDREFKQSAKDIPNNYEIELPSGRVLSYYNVQAVPDFSAQVTLGSFNKRLWGGLLCENVVQGTARDLLAESILKLENHFPMVLHVHDEVVLEVKQKVHPKEVEEVMLQLPEWAENLPVGVDLKELERYGK